MRNSWLYTEVLEELWISHQYKDLTGGSKSRHMRSEFGWVGSRTKKEINSSYYRQVRTSDARAWSAVTGGVVRLLEKGARKHSASPKSTWGPPGLLLCDLCCCKFPGVLYSQHRSDIRDRC